jgi:hypothetical protein
MGLCQSPINFPFFLNPTLPYSGLCIIHAPHSPERLSSLGMGSTCLEPCLFIVNQYLIFEPKLINKDLHKAKAIFFIVKSIIIKKKGLKAYKIKYVIEGWLVSWACAFFNFLSPLILHSYSLMCGCLQATSVAAGSQATKALLRLKRDPRQSVETVFMRHRRRETSVCISSQCGCAMGCRFCATPGVAPED